MIGAIAQVLVALSIAGISIAQARAHGSPACRAPAGRSASTPATAPAGSRARAGCMREVLTDAAGAPQVIACAGNAFSIDNRFSKREYELIFGAVLMLFALVPVRPRPSSL